MADDDVEEVVDDQPLEDSTDEFLDEADEHEESGEDFEARIAKGDKDTEPYSKEGREEMEENDEAKPGELGYVKGASRNKRHK
jgi:hypothetical protein